MLQMEEARNKNMADEFNPYWTNVLDKSMIDWYNNFSLGSCVLGVNHIDLVKISIRYAVGLPRFFGSYILSRGRINRHRWAQRFTQS